MISVQQQDFDIQTEYNHLASDHSNGAIVTFVGKVRDFNQDDKVAGLALEHYPGMTEKALNDIAAEAMQRWPIAEPRIIHRVGELGLGDQIVYIGVSSPHRKAAFDACEFLIDYLKTKAPFWKKEQTEDGFRWVDARESDEAAANKW